MSCSFSIFYARHRNYYLKGMPGNYLTTIISRMSAWSPYIKKHTYTNNEYAKLRYFA